MVDRLKTEAEALAVALDVGAINVSDVIAWADAVIDTEEHPHWSICEVATVGTKYPPDVANALREVPGEADIGEVQRWLRATLLVSSCRNGALRTSGALASAMTCVD